MLYVWPLRDDGPAGVRPWMTLTLMAACTGASWWLWALPADAASAALHGLGLIPADLTQGGWLPQPPVGHSRWLAPLTSLVLHAGWAHLLVNLAYLWLFGRGLEAALGHWRLLVLFLAAGIAGEICQITAVPSSHLPMIGASGGISGMLGAYLLLFPRANILTLARFGRTSLVVRVPALLIIGAWLAAELLALVRMNPATGGTASLAHLGGFAAGMLLVPLVRTPGLSLFQPARTLAFSAVRHEGAVNPRYRPERD